MGPPTLYIGASRFTGESVAGLVVGAMGVFLFTLAFRDWLSRRGSVTRPEDA